MLFSEHLFVRMVRLELTQAKRPLPPQSSVSTIPPHPLWDRKFRYILEIRKIFQVFVNFVLPKIHKINSPGMLSVAKILKSNGTDGGLLVSSGVDFASMDFAEPVYIPFEGLQVPFFVQSCRERGARYIVHLNDVTSLEDAEELVGREIFADVSVEEDDTRDFTGWSVYDGGAAATFGHSAAPVFVGKVTGDEPIPGNYCLYVELASGPLKDGRAEVLIPLHPDLVVSADPAARELVLDLPAGLY